MANRNRKQQKVEIEQCIRNARQKPRRGYIRNAIVTAATAQAVVVAKELFHHQMDHGRLMTYLTAIPSPIGGAPLRIHSRYRNDALTTLPSIVLVHGFGMGSSYMIPLGAQLATEANVYIPELPGHGRSDHDLRPLKIAELAEALGTWMEQRGLRAALLVGHSLGCQIVAELASKRADLVSSLVFLGPASDPGAPSSSEQISRALKATLFERKSLSVWTAMDYKRAGMRVLKEELKEVVRHRFQIILPNLDVPVRVIRGEKDSVSSQEWAEAVASNCRADRPIVVPNCAHAVHYGEPKIVAQLILNFAKNLVDKSQTEKTPVLQEETSKN